MAEEIQKGKEATVTLSLNFMMMNNKFEGVGDIMTWPMILFCPNGHRHIDEGEFLEKAHHTHACQECGIVWRPAKINTHGVQFLPGYKNGEPKPETATVGFATACKEEPELTDLDWFSHQHNLELKYHSPIYGDDDDQTCEWRVIKRSGNINDREWTCVGKGRYVSTAISEAREWMTVA